MASSEYPEKDISDLFELLRRARKFYDAKSRKNFDRSLPFPELMFDRWERARELGFGENVSIYDSALVYGCPKIGAHSWIGPYCLLDASGGSLTIGSYCSFASGSHIYTHDTILWALSGGKLDRDTGDVFIGDCVYIGSQAIILPGVTIGNRSVIASNSLVNRDVPEGTIYGGTPVRKLGHVEGEGENVRLVYEK